MLKTLDLSSFSTVSLKMTRDMFLRCNSLETVYVNPEQWNYNLVHGIYAGRDDQGNGSCMFKGCGKLKGQNGTKVTNYNIPVHLPADRRSCCLRHRQEKADREKEGGAGRQAQSPSGG